MAENVPHIPHVEIQNVDHLSVSFKKGAAKISFEVPTPGPEMLKLMYFSLTAQPLNVVIESPQAEMELKIETVDVKTGEVRT